LTNATTVLVTAGAGFIGSHVTAGLLRRGHAVRVLDNVSTGKRENLAAVGGDVELVEGDIRSYERTSPLAALPSLPRSIQDPLTTNAVNVTGTLKVVLAARDAGPKRVVFASSSSVYGIGLEAPRQLNVFGWLRGPEGADVYLNSGRGGLLGHAQHLLGGGRVKVFLATVRADHGRHVLGDEGELAALQHDRCRAGPGLAVAAAGAHHRVSGARASLVGSRCASAILSLKASILGSVAAVSRMNSAYEVNSLFLAS
jgi:hypothetical protein